MKFIHNTCKEHDFRPDGVAYTKLHLSIDPFACDESNSILPCTLFMHFNFPCYVTLRSNSNKLSICNSWQRSSHPEGALAFSPCIFTRFYFFWQRQKRILYTMYRHRHTWRMQRHNVKDKRTKTHYLTDFDFYSILFSFVALAAPSVSCDIMWTPICQWKNRMQRTDWSS